MIIYNYITKYNIRIAISIMPKKVKQQKNSKTKSNGDVKVKKDTILPKIEHDQHVGVITKKYGGQRFDVLIESDTGHKGKNVNAKAHCARKNIRIENDNYVLLEYSVLNSGTFFIVHVYQPDDYAVLIQKNIIPPKVSSDESGDVVFADHGSSATEEFNFAEI
jgi:hypothetical protein